MLIYVLYFLSLHYSCLDMDSVGSFQRSNKEHRIKWVIICKVFYFYLLNIVVYTYSLQLTDVYTLQSNTAYRFVHFTVYSLLCTLYNLIHLTDLYTLQFTAYRCVHFTLYSLLQLSDVYTLQSTTTFRCVHFTVYYSLQICALYSLQLTDVYTLHSTTAFRCAHFTVYYRFKMCTLYSLLQLTDMCAYSPQHTDVYSLIQFKDLYTSQSTYYRNVHFTVYSLQVCTLYSIIQLTDLDP